MNRTGLRLDSESFGGKSPFRGHLLNVLSTCLGNTRVCSAHAANTAYPDVSYFRAAGTLVQQLVHIDLLFPVCSFCVSIITLGEVNVFTRCVQSFVAFAD